jgi:hypothetical protein
MLLPLGSGRGEIGSESTELTSEERAAIPEPKRGYLHNIAKKLVLGLDAPVESFLIRRNVALPVGNCGFLFQAV